MRQPVTKMCRIHSEDGRQIDRNLLLSELVAPALPARAEPHELTPELRAVVRYIQVRELVSNHRSDLVPSVIDEVRV